MTRDRRIVVAPRPGDVPRSAPPLPGAPIVEELRAENARLAIELAEARAAERNANKRAAVFRDSLIELMRREGMLP